MKVLNLIRRGKEIVHDTEIVNFYWDRECTRLRGQTSRMELINLLNGDSDYITDYDTGKLLSRRLTTSESEWDCFADVETL